MNSRFLSRLGTPLLLVAGLAACDPDTAPPFTIDETGGVEGLLFYDADEDNVFDPSDGDFALEGVTVRFTVRGDTTQVYTTATTDAQGRLTATGLPAGTLDAYFVESTLPEDVRICVNPQQVTVVPGETRFFRVESREACLVLISEVKTIPADEDNAVLIRGVVTVPQGAFRGDNAYVQDASGGIQIFGVPGSAQLQVGDVVEVGGVVGEHNDEIQVERLSSVQKVGETTPPAPYVPEIEEFRLRELDGLLVRMNALTVQSVGNPDSQGRFTVRVSPEGGPENYVFEIRIEGGVDDVTPAAFTVGATYDVIGVASVFNNAAQLKPRSLADIMEAS